MKVLFNTNTPIYKSPNRNISFEAGELNHKWAKKLKKSLANFSDAQALHRCLQRETIEYTPERYQAILDGIANAPNKPVKYWFELMKKEWDKFVK